EPDGDVAVADRLVVLQPREHVGGDPDDDALHLGAGGAAQQHALEAVQPGGQERGGDRLAGAAPERRRVGQGAVDEQPHPKIFPKFFISAASTSAMPAFTPSAARLVTPCSRMPQGTMPEKCERSGFTFSASPCQLTQRLTRTPI